SIGTHFSWNPISNAIGYRLTIGTTLGGNDILNNMDVGNVTTYNLPTDLAYNTTYYVSIIPYNSAGNAQSCQEFSFTTEQEPITIPSCTILTFPANNATNVSIGTHFSWNPISNAIGYRLTIGTTSGGNYILNNTDVGNVTTYNLPNDLTYNTTYYVSIIPYNSAGNAQSCQEFSFTTEQEPCPTLLVNLEVSGNSVRIIVLNGNPPYAYNLDQQGWTTNNLFTHLSYGTHQIEVRTSNGCSTSLTFDILEVQNFISPNGDGKNDLLDFSFLSTKENPKLLIADRFGKAVFKDHGESNFIWNGKHPSGSPLPSTTYWYRLEWKEANAENTTSLQGAILLKSK
ncbi:T9SS type B sorting domain-containing protein, partial [Empedobacter brevis]|uniref:T9SS type B sorting domain-containing protein n=1 Tax=Empedobacter brevis TaxID=247 RepID=UPI002FE3FB70